MKSTTLTRRQITHAEWYRKNRSRVRAKANLRRAENPEKYREIVNRSSKKHRDANLAKNRKLRADLRAKALTALGGKCAFCGYDVDNRALQIDHINGGGSEELRHAKGTVYYRRVANNWDQGKYQLLCANCNVIKVDENQERRHRVT